MGDFLLISDDLSRAERLARSLAPYGACKVHDLYGDMPACDGERLIISDVEYLDSGAFVRLKQRLDRVRREGMPHLFLVHGNAARGEAQAGILGATATLAAATAPHRLSDAIAQLSGQPQPIRAVTQKHAAGAKQFLTDTFFSGRAVTPALAETGTDLVSRAISETGIRDWVQAVQHFDDVTHQHCLLVAGLAAAFSSALGLSPADCHRLAKAALLHDVGKTKIPPAILNKAAKLDETELKVMRTHPALGHAMLAGRGFDATMLTVVRSHHEMLDGSGYPDKLKGSEIPDLVRLVAICDIYAALIERRPYKPPMESAKAYGILESMAGRLDSDLVRAFRPVVSAYGAPDPMAAT
ncbi:HD-GYP domain-containing protein [Methylobacterium sp. P31]